MSVAEKVKVAVKKDKIRLYRLASCDITSNCNLRCKFCFNDFSQKNYNMTEDIFENAFKVAEYLPDIVDMNGNGFYFSCLWEPSINPGFMNLVQMLPSKYKERVFFTSNFAKKYDDEMFEILAKANIHHINISIETLEREKYKELTGGTDANYDIFFDNLKRLSQIFAKYETAPKVRYISMALKSNHEELGAIVEKCHNEYHAFLSEVRTPFYGAYLENLKKELLSKEEIDYLNDLFAKSDKNISYCLHEVNPPGTETAEQDSQAENCEPVKRNGKEDKLAHIVLEEMPEWYYDIRIESNGNVIWNGNEERHPYDALSDYNMVFSDGLDRLMKGEAKRYERENEEIEKYMRLYPSVLKKSFFEIDDFEEDKKFFRIRGWAGIKGMASENQIKILEISQMDVGKKKRYYVCENECRPDVAEIMQEPFMYAGFQVLIDKENIYKDVLQARVLFYDKKKNRITYAASQRIELNM